MWPQERLSKGGENLPNVIQYLKEQHPERLELIFFVLRKTHSPSRVDAEPTCQMAAGIQIKDALNSPCCPSLRQTAQWCCCLFNRALYPAPPQFIGIEEPENFLHPRLLPAEECRAAAEFSQLLDYQSLAIFAQRNACRRSPRTLPR